MNVRLTAKDEARIAAQWPDYFIEAEISHSDGRREVSVTGLYE